MTVFKEMSHGRCTIHFKQNCKAFLKGIGIIEGRQAPLLEVAFGEDGLIESEDEEDLKRRILIASELLPQIETELLQSTTESSKFSKYVKDHTDVLSCLIRKRKGKMTMI